MGMLTNIRRISKSKRSRIFWLALTVVLGIGLVGSYIAFSAPPNPPSGGQQSQQDLQKQAEALLAQARQQVEALEKEISTLKEELKVDPGNVKKLEKLADDQFYLGSLYLYPLSDQAKSKAAFEAAVESLQQVIKLDPEAKDVRLKLATAALQAGKQDLAEQNLQQAVAEDPKDIDARVSYGIFLALYKKDYRQAITQWEEVLAQNPPEETASYVKSLIEQVKAADSQAGGSEGGKQK
ncbi:MAG: hypothetical protein PWP65_364 [Clostridia bacterium]|nr:hypothetical protein [Clostridia bacterium]